MGNGVGRPWIPDEDDVPAMISFTWGDVDVLENALGLYCLWLRQKGTLPVEYGDVSPEQEKILERLSELNISPQQLAIELKSSTLQHAEQLRELVANALRNREEDTPPIDSP